MIGELLITVAVLIVLFLGWQLFVNDLVVGAQQQDAAGRLSQRWAAGEQASTPVDDREPEQATTDEPRTDEPGTDDSGQAGPQPDPGTPIVREAPGYGKAFATLIVPRLGADYSRAIAQGVGFDVLNSAETGIGHYPDTQMPGAVGNFAVAAHRTTYGAPFRHLDELRVGDPIYVETADGWYRYAFRSLEYVVPSSVSVLEPVPQSPGIAAVDRVITLTTCNPLFSADERLIAYGVFEEWYPRAGGAPDQIAELVQAGGR